MITRYDLETINYETCMEEWEHGQWVKWDDVKDKLIDWQPITDCPKDVTTCLGLLKSGHYEKIYRVDKEWTNVQGVVLPYTHFIILPALLKPKE